MEVLAGAALFLLGGNLLGEATLRLALPWRRRLLAFQGLGVAPVALGLGLLTGSGTGLTLLGAALYRLGLFSLLEAGLLALGGTLGATFLVGVAGLGARGLALGLLALGFFLELFRLRPGARAALGLGLLFLGVEVARGGAWALAPYLRDLPPWGVFGAGLLLASLVGSANLFALLALALLQGGALSPGGASALVLAAGVGATGPLFLLREVAAARLALALLPHRLLLALALLPWGGAFPPLGLHALYHALALLLWPPLGSFWAGLAGRILPERRPSPKYLDPKALGDPTWAQALALRELGRVGDAVVGLFRMALQALRREEGRESLLEPLEEKVDRLAREVLLYAGALAARGAEVLPLLEAASELEHLGDLGKRFLRKAERLWAQGLTFSPEGRRELLEAGEALLSRLERAVAALATGNPELAQAVLAEPPLDLKALRQAHLERLRLGRRETQASTLTHLDLLLLLEELDQGVRRLVGLIGERDSVW